MWKLCLLIVPLNPLPLEVPETSTLSPTAKMSALISLPISKDAQFSNLNQSTVLVTTHSPYVLTAANVLHYAGRLGKKYGNQVGRVVGKDKWIAPDEFTAFKLEQDEQGHTSAELLVDDETEELRTSLIDEISNEIGETYTKLYYLEVDNEDT